MTAASVPAHSFSFSAQSTNTSDIIFYTTPQGEVRIEVYFEDETLGLSQKKMAEPLDKDTNTTGEHLRNIFDDDELDKKATTRKFRVVQIEGGCEVRREVEH